MSARPRVSCILPTRNRRILCRQAIGYWLRQEWPVRSLELVIVDGAEQKSLGVGDLGGVARYVHAPGVPTGTARNIACENATGEIVVHLDDDDWYAPHYVETVVGMIESGAGELVGCAQSYQYDWQAKRGWRSGLWSAPQPSGPTFCYWRSEWAKHPFPDIVRGEDNEFYKATERAGGKVVGLHRPDLHVYMRHQVNTTGHTQGIRDPSQTAHVRELLGDDLAFYDELAELFPVAKLDPSWHVPRAGRR